MVLELPDLVSSYWKEVHRETENEILSRGAAETTKSITIGEPIDVLNLPHKINSWNLLEDDWKWFFVDKGVGRQLVFDGQIVRFAKLSPDHKKMGFYFYPEDYALGEIVLAALDIEKKVVKEIYHGDTRTSNWEWRGDKVVIVKRSCGTECMVASVLDINNGETIDKYRVY